MQKTGLTTLKERRRCGDMMEVYKTLRGMNRVNKGEWFDIRSGEEARPTRTNTVVVEEGGVTTNEKDRDSLQTVSQRGD